MAFYNSGIRRLGKERNTAINRQVEQLKTNEKADDTQATTDRAAIALNTAKTGITSGQASAITANTAKRSSEVYTSILEGSLANWNNAATSSGDAVSFQGIDLTRDVILDVTMEAYGPANEGSNYAMTAVCTNNPVIFLDPVSNIGSGQIDGVLYRSTWMAAASTNTTGGPVISKLEYSGNKYNAGDNGTLTAVGSAVPLKASLDIAFTMSNADHLEANKIRLIVTYFKGGEARSYNS